MQDLHGKASSSNKLIKELKAENEELKSRLRIASNGVPPLPRGSSKGSSLIPESVERKMGKIVKGKIQAALQKSQPLQTADPSVGTSMPRERVQQLPPSASAAEAEIIRDMREHELRRPHLGPVSYDQCDQHGYHDGLYYDNWFTDRHQQETGSRQAAAPLSVTLQGQPRARSSSPGVAATDNSLRRRTKQETALAAVQLEPKGYIQDKDLIDIKILRQYPNLCVPSSATNFRTWKMGILHGLTSFDTSGSMRNYLGAAMNMRGDEQLKLKFQDHPMNQAMGILAAKFMHDPNFKHPTFGPMLETYSQECLRNNCSPTAPYIMSYISAWYDTSSGGTVTKRDLYAIKCAGRSMQNLSDFTAQVDYVVSQI